MRVRSVPVRRKRRRDTAPEMGSGWYRQLLFLVLAVVALLAGLSAALRGSSAVLTVGIVVTALGVLALAVYASPWFEQEWPLDGKDGWLVAGSMLTTAGTPMVALGIALRTLL